MGRYPREPDGTLALFRGAESRAAKNDHAGDDEGKHPRCLLPGDRRGKVAGDQEDL